jgi:4-cresol dehydrogenase (hydroxylating)
MLSAHSPASERLNRHLAPSLSAALAEWALIVGRDNVHTDSTTTREAGTATFATSSTVLAVVRPGTCDEVQGCVRVANEFRIAIYPISSGKNWGYGSRAPVRDGVLLDLGRLNRILDFDEDLAYVTIEPGVTQRQLHNFLSARQSRLWMDATGASPDCSIVGNTMERGFGHTPMGDHCANVCGLEVVLPTGDVVRTGFGRFGDSKVASVNRWGVGPSLDGLFSQSSFGIVTRMTVWLMPAPECFQAFFFKCGSEQDLGAVIDALRPLRMDGTLRSVAHIGNDYKVLSGVGHYPWDAAGGATPLGSTTMAGLRKKLDIGCWNGAGGLYGTRAQVREARRLIRRALAGKAERVRFVDDRALHLASRFATPLRVLTGWDLSRVLKLLAPVYGLLKGTPSDETMGSTYWRTRQRVESAQANPDRDGCGLLWCSPVVPSTGAHATEVAALAKQTLLDHGFEPQISVSMANERSLIFIITISYDRAIPREDDRALRCYKTLTSELLKRGYPPYRVNVASMALVEGVSPSDQMVRDLKGVLDPNGILAPGRYDASGGQSIRDSVYTPAPSMIPQ